MRPGFAFTMLFVGTLVRPEQVRAFSRSPSRALAGLGAQYTIMPLTAWAISQAFDDPLLQVGIVLVGCMPGAMASNVMTLLFKGDLILSVAMTTLATLSCPSFWPSGCPSGRYAGRGSRGPLAWNATWMVVLPVAVGIGIRYLTSEMPPRWDRTETGSGFDRHRAHHSGRSSREPRTTVPHRSRPGVGDARVEPGRVLAGLRGRKVASLANRTTPDAGD